MSSYANQKECQFLGLKNRVKSRAKVYSRDVDVQQQRWYCHTG
ncbi:hypothetical protein ALTERO38_60251 [Alteromonas sp. 38]|nr:hypothetical protein ALTER154_40542 [Alteromonas sp. 154]VXC14716.1 hypothetical protein ALTERO38_60251 [Alteromonas sp. 38]